jgi:5-methylcytosine-specific restriction protein A
MVSTDRFRRELRAQLSRASTSGLTDALVNAGELHRMLGGYPGSQHGMQHCRDAMRAEMQPGDLIIENNGESNLTVRYQLPRKSHTN